MPDTVIATPPAPPPTPIPPTATTTPPAAPPTSAAAAEQSDRDEFLSYSKEIEEGVKKATETPSPPPPPPTAEPPKPPTTPDTPASLRKQYEATKAEVASLTSKISSYEARIKEYEERNKDTSLLVERQKQLEKERDDLAGKLRAKDFESSPEFKKNFQEPFDDAVADAKGGVVGIQVTNEETGLTRMTTWEDFVQIYNMPEAAARAEAVKMFGEVGAQVAIDHYRELHRLDRKMNKALTDERANWKQKQEREEADRVRNEEEGKNLFQRAHQELAEQNPDYRDDPTDSELVAARKRGNELFEAKPKTFQQAVLYAAHKRHMVESYFPNKLKIARLTAELEKVKAENQKLKGVPGGQAKPETAGGQTHEETEEEWARNTKSAVEAAG